MTGRPRLRARPAGAILLAGLVAATLAACSGERERLSPPTIQLELIDTIALPGDSIRGRIIGFDENSKLSSVAARARTGDSVYVRRADLFGLESVEFTFALHVPSDAVDGTPIEITGSVINKQLLSRDTTAFAFVRVPAAP